MTYKGIKNILAEFYKRLKEDPTFTAGSSEVLSKLSESADGKLLYDGKEVTASSEIQLISKEDYDNLIVKDETVFYLIVDDQENILLTDATILNAIYQDVPTSTESSSNVLSLDSNNQLVLVPNDNHTNKDILDKLSESETGQLLYNGETISTTSIKLITRSEYDALETKDEKTLYIITDDNNTNLDTNVLEKLSESSSGELLYDGKKINTTITTLTRSEYEALETKDDDVIYIITDEDGVTNSLAEQLLDDTQTSKTKTFSSNHIDSTYIKYESDHHIIKDIENLTANTIYLKITDFASTINNSVNVKLDAIRINTTASIQQASATKYQSNLSYNLLKIRDPGYLDPATVSLADASYLLVDNNYDIYVQIGSYSIATLDIIFYDNSSSFITLETVDSLPTDYLGNGYTAEVGLN